MNRALLPAGVLMTAMVPAMVPAQGPGPVAVLNNDTIFRTYAVYRTPVSVSAAGPVKALVEPGAKDQRPVADFASPSPPADWTQADFNDSTWERQRAPVEPEHPPAYVWGPRVAAYGATATARLCLRGKFLVDDPATVRDLQLSLEYVGGVVVYLNGWEVARGHVPDGPLTADTLAERYPDDLYVEPGGLFLQDIRKNPAGFERRYRRLTGVAVPSEHLREGVNVLAVEVYRAAVNQAAVEARRMPVGGMSVVPGLWPYAELKGVSLTAAAGSALAANVSRPQGVQVWNVAPYETVGAFDYGDPGAPAPVAVSAPRNGVFSGRLVVSSDSAIQGLRVTVSDLVRTGGGGTLAASTVRVRCAVPAAPGKSWVPPTRFDGLLDAIPEAVPVISARPLREEYLRRPAYGGIPIERENLTPGALAPIWLTVCVPVDAAPGRYEGTVTVTADGLPPTAVPLHVTVFDWTMPDPKDFRVTNFSQTSPDSLAQHYKVPLWSERHLELLGRSLALMAEVGSRQAIAELSIDFYGLAGNAETMVRWVSQPDGSYAHDFTIFEKYLDVVEKSMGKPRLLRLNCWGEVRPGWGRAGNDPLEIWTANRLGTTVTRLDPKTGELSAMAQPLPSTPEGFAFWKPVLDEIRRKVEARGWFDVTAMGHNSYNGHPYPPFVDTFMRIWPDGIWSYTAHNGTLGMRFSGTEKGRSMPVRYSDCVWTRGNLTARGYRALLEGRPAYWCWTNRGVMREASPLTLLREVAEGEIMRGQDGVSDFGADFFPIETARGRYTCVGNGRGTGGPNNSTRAMLAPGPEGPIATERFEMLREGVQLCEAILFIQRALEEKQVPVDLAERANRYLDQRGQAYLWRWYAGRFERDRELLALAAEVAKAK